MDYAELFKRCNHVVAVRSTLIYIALQAGKNVYLFKRSNYSWDSDIFKYMQLFDNVAELKSYIDNVSEKKFKDFSEPPIFFQEFDSQRFVQILHDIGSCK